MANGHNQGLIITCYFL